MNIFFGADMTLLGAAVPGAVAQVNARFIRPLRRGKGRPASLAGALDGRAIKLKLVADQAEPEFPRHPLLDLLDLLVAELDDLACFDIDQVVVVAARGLFVAPAASAEVMTLEDAF